MNIFQLQNQPSSQIKPRCRNVANVNLLKQKMDKLTGQVHDHIVKQVQLGLLSIPQQFEPLRIRRRLKIEQSQTENKPNQQQLMQKLEERRKQTLQKLLNIENQERQLRLNKSQSLRKNRRMISQRSQKITKQQLAAIKNIIKKKKQYDSFLQNQTQTVIQKQRQFKLQDQKAHASSIQKIKDLRRQAAQDKIKSLLERKQQRIKAAKQFRVQRNPKTQKYIFNLNKQKFQEKLAEQKREYQKKLSLLKEKVAPNIQQIRLHEAQYLKKKQKKPTKFVDMGVSTEEFSNQSDSGDIGQQPAKHKFNYVTNMRVFQENRFSKILKEEQLERQQIQKQRSQMSHQRKIKIKQFQKYVNSKFRPKTVKSRNQTQPGQVQDKKQKSLSYHQINEIGKKYLRIARSLKKSEQDQLIDYNPFNNQQFKQMFNRGRTNARNPESNNNFQKIIERFFSNRTSKTQKNMDSEANETGASSEFKLTSKFSKDQRLFLSVKNKLQFLSYIQ